MRLSIGHRRAIRGPGGLVGKWERPGYSVIDLPKPLDRWSVLLMGRGAADPVLQPLGVTLFGESHIHHVGWRRKRSGWCSRVDAAGVTFATGGSPGIERHAVVLAGLEFYADGKLVWTEQIQRPGPVTRIQFDVWGGDLELVQLFDRVLSAADVSAVTARALH